jgi:hypothetical protein
MIINPFQELKVWLLETVGHPMADKILTMKAWHHHNDQGLYALCLGSKALYLERCKEKNIEPQLYISRDHIKQVFPDLHPEDTDCLELYYSDWLTGQFERYSPGVFGWDYSPLPNVFCPDMWPTPWSTSLLSTSRIALNLSLKQPTIMLTLVNVIQAYYIDRFSQYDQSIIDLIATSKFLQPAVTYLFLNSLDEQEEDGSCTSCDFVFNYSATETVESRCREFAKYLSEPKQQQAIHLLVKALISNSK